MKVKAKNRKSKSIVDRKRGPLRRSQRLKDRSAPLSTEKVKQTNGKKFHKISSKTVIKKTQPTIGSAKFKPSGSCDAEKTKRKQTPKISRKTKPKSKTPQKIEINPRQEPIDPIDNKQDPNTTRILKLPLLKTIQLGQNYYGDVSATRFSDVAFLDDNHILALDDSYLRKNQGHRVCCINIDGTLVCDVLVPGYPWSIVVLSPTEAVATVRRLESDGLIWISIDVHAKSIEITKHLHLDQEPFGLSYDDMSDVYIVSYDTHPYMSILNRNGKEIRKIPLQQGLHYRCWILEDKNILYLDYRKRTVNVINQKGKEIMSLEHVSHYDPISLKTDCLENIYVGTFGFGLIFKFDKCGRHRATFQIGSDLVGMGIDRKAERIVVAKNNLLLLYELDKNA